MQLSTRADYSTLISSGASNVSADAAAFFRGASSVTYSSGALVEIAPNTTYYFRISSAPAAVMDPGEFGTFNAAGATATYAAPLIEVTGSFHTAYAAYFIYDTNTNPLLKTTFTFTVSTSPTFTPADEGQYSLYQVSLATMARKNPEQVTLSGLFQNTTYYVRAVAFNHQQASTTVNFDRIGTAASQPRKADAAFPEVGVSTISISWNAGPDFINPVGVTSYTVVASSSLIYPTMNLNSFPGRISIVTINRSTSATGYLSPNTSYHFFVAGVDNIYGKHSTYTLLGTTSTLARDPLSFAALSSADSLSTSPARGTSFLTLQWFTHGNPAAKTTYTVTGSTASDFSLSDAAPYQVALDTRPAGVVMATATLTGLRPLTTYFLRVRAVNHNKVFTSYVSLGSTATVPAPVTSLAVTSAGVNTLAFSWADNPGGDALGNPAAGQKYLVTLSTDFFVTGVNEALTVLTSATFAGLAQGVNHQLRVKVRSPFGLGVDESSATQVGATTLSGQQRPAADVTSATFAGVGIGSMTASWLDGGNAAGTLYRVQVSTDASFATINMSSETKNLSAYFSEGINTPNTEHYFRVQSSGTAGASAFISLGSTVTLARPPRNSMTFPPNVFRSSAIVCWDLHAGPANPALTMAEVHRSTSADFTTILSSQAVFRLSASGMVLHTPKDLLGCTTFFFRIRNKNHGGVLTPFDKDVVITTSNTIPSAPPGLTATSAAGGKIKLSWGQAGPEGVVSYQIYTDSGTDQLIFSTGAAAGRIAFLSSATFEFTTGALPSTAAVRFMVTAKHRCGEEPVTGAVVIAVATGTLSSVRAAIITQTGDIASNSNNLTLGAALISGSPNQVLSVLFQYRLSGTTQYYDIGTDTSAPYGVTWDLSTAGEPDVFGLVQPLVTTGFKDVDMRAIATDIFGYPETAPAALRARIVAAGTVGAVTESKDGAGVVSKVVSLPANTAASVISSGLGSDGTQRTARLDFPANAFPLQTQITVNPNPALASMPALPSSGAFAGIAARFTLEPGRSLPAGVTVAFTLTVLDADGNGIVDGTDTRLFDARLLSHDESAGGSWKEDVATSYDAESKTVTGVTSHFTFFALAGTVRANLDLVRVYPVPFKPNGANADEGRPFVAGDPNSGISFDNLPSRVTIKIYTVSGGLAAKFSTEAGSGRFIWDARNDAGRNVASGGYFAVISSPGLKSVVKRLAILR